MDDKKTTRPGATEATASSARAHDAGDDGAEAGGTKRFSAKRKLTAVQRLMRGESLEAVSRDLNVPVRHGDAVYASQRIAPTKRRLSAPLLPGSPGLPGPSGSIRAHCTSISVRLMPKSA